MLIRYLFHPLIKFDNSPHITNFRVNNNREKIQHLHVTRCNTYDRNKMIPILDELNKNDKNDIFEIKKASIQEKFGPEIAENVTEELANDLLFLHRWYILDKASTKEDRISLRKHIKSIYELNKNVPEPLHKVLIDVLIKNKAIEDI